MGSTGTVTERWPRRPPKDARCDASTGSGADHLGDPVVYRCPNSAEETARDGFGHEMWLCPTCAATLALRGHVRRNPKRRPR